MRTQIETSRLILRELIPSDEISMFEMDRDPEVHRFLGNSPLTSMSQTREIIARVRQQYLDNGIGRWAAVLKESNTFIGWCGLKLENNINGHEHFYDLGYRFMKQYWGNGYGYESAKAFVDFGFNDMGIDTICAHLVKGNMGSQRIMEKCGLHYVNDFIHDGLACSWYEIHNRDSFAKSTL